MNLKNKTVLVTGADGFIGSHLTGSLLKEGAKVKVLPYMSSILVNQEYNSRYHCDRMHG